MAVAIPFTADLTEVRAQLDRLVADARATKVPIGGSFAAGVGGGGGASTPTVQGIFGGSPGGVAGSFGAGVGSPFGGGAAPLGSGGFFSAGPTGIQVFGYPGSPATAVGTGAMAVAAPSGATVVMQNTGGGGGAAQGGTAASILGGGGSGRFLGLNTSGLSRYVGAGFLAREALRGAQLSADYNEQVALAGNDQRSILKAEQSFQKGVGSFPIVGQAAELIANSIAETSGFGRTGTEATLRAADSQEEGVNLRRQFGRQSQRLRDEILTTSQTSSSDRDLIEGEISHRERLQSIADKNNDILASDRKRRGDEAIGLESTRYARVKEQSGRLPGFFPNWAVDALGYGDDVAAQQAADARRIADEREQDTAGAKKRSSAEIDAENRRFDAESSQRFRVRNRESLIEGSALAGTASVFKAIAGGASSDDASRLALVNEVNQSNLKALTDPNISGASRIGIVFNNAQRLAADARQRDDRKLEEKSNRIAFLDSAGFENQSRASSIKGSNINSELLAIESRRSSALSSLTGEKVFKDISDAVNRGFDLEKQQALTSDTRGRRRRNESLDAEGRILDIELKDSPYARQQASAAAIKENAFQKVAALLDVDHPGQNKNEIAKTLQNAQKEEELEAKNFLRRFRPEEFNINRSASGNFGDGAESTLKEMAGYLAAIKDAAQNWGKAQ